MTSCNYHRKFIKPNLKYKHDKKLIEFKGSQQIHGRNWIDNCGEIINEKKKSTFEIVKWRKRG